MRLWHAVTAGALGSAGAALVVALLSRMWQACGVGVNAAADAGALLFGYGPAVTAAIAAPTVAILAFGDRRGDAATRSAAGAIAALLALLICWIALSIGHDPGGHYPSPHCAGNIPPWWPDWIPL